MNPFEPATIRCRCGHEYTAEVATGLHVSSRPELRDAILAGTLHRFVCPACGAPTIIEPALAYTDFPRQHWFTVAPRSGIGDRGGWHALADDSFQSTMVDNAPPMV
ncbi:MAG: CpXC domain-containing protein, partial [Myxococcota bacterium]